MRNWLIVLACGLFFLFYKLGDAPLWERDEPKYAEPGWRMAVTGDWLTPRFNGAVRFDKPPLFYWLEAISFRTFGKTEFAARFPSALAGLGIASLTYAFGKKMTNATTALLAALILIISPHFLLQCHLAVVDAVLTFFLLLAFYAVYELGNNKPTSQKKTIVPQEPAAYLYIAAFAIAMATLTKGPIGIILPFTLALTWHFFSKDIRYSFSIHHILGAAGLFLILVLPWYIAISKLHGESFSNSFFIFHNVTRFLQPVDSHKEPFWFYIPILLAGFFPWSIFLFHAAKSGIKELSKSNLLFIITWPVLIFAFFTIAKTKLGSYIFPAYPAMALLVGSFLMKFFEQKKELFRLFYVLIVTIGIIFWFGITFLVPNAAEKNSSKTIAKNLIANGLSSNNQIVLYNNVLNGIVFYTGHQVQFIPKNQEIQQTLISGFPTFFIFPKKDLPALKNLLLNSNWHLLYETTDLLIYTNISKLPQLR